MGKGYVQMNITNLPLNLEAEAAVLPCGRLSSVGRNVECLDTTPNPALVFANERYHHALDFEFPGRNQIGVTRVLGF